MHQHQKGERDDRRIVQEYFCGAKVLMDVKDAAAQPMTECLEGDIDCEKLIHATQL